MTRVCTQSCGVKVSLMNRYLYHPKSRSCSWLYFIQSVSVSLHLHPPSPWRAQELISTWRARSPRRMWPCLIVQQVHLLARRDVVIAYLFSSGLLSHIKMIDSFHSGYIYRALFDKLMPKVLTSVLFSRSESCNVYRWGLLFTRLIVSPANYLCLNNFACASLFILLELSGPKGLALAMPLKSPKSPLYMLSCPRQTAKSSGNTVIFLFK